MAELEHSQTIKLMYPAINNGICSPKLVNNALFLLRNQTKVQSKVPILYGKIFRFVNKIPDKIRIVLSHFNLINITDPLLMFVVCSYNKLI